MGTAHPDSLPFVYPYALVFWALFVAVFVPEFLLIRKVGRQRPARQDRGSTRVIMLGNVAGGWFAFACPFLLPSYNIVSGRVAVFWLGIALLAAGGLVRQHCFRMLGASFKPIVEVRTDQAVVQRGAYRFLRHPSYAGAIVLFLGIGFALTNWMSVLGTIVMLAIVYGYRIHVEEAALVSTLGDSYRSYMARTKRIVPFVW
jgi:protein-S-isoprenylcysteine O-methyltransferase Ste14